YAERLAAYVDAIDVLAVVAVNHATFGTVGDEIAAHVPPAIVQRRDTHIAHHGALPRAWEFRVRFLLGEPHDALAQPHVIVGNVEQRRSRIGLVGFSPPRD